MYTHSNEGTETRVLSNQHYRALAINDLAHKIGSLCRVHIGSARLFNTHQIAIPAIVFFGCGIDQLSPAIVNIEIVKACDAHQHGFEDIVSSICIGGKSIGYQDIGTAPVHMHHNIIITVATFGARYF